MYIGSRLQRVNGVFIATYLFNIGTIAINDFGTQKSVRFNRVIILTRLVVNGTQRTNTSGLLHGTFVRGKRQIYLMVPTFPDLQNSLTFPVFFFHFSSILLMFCFVFLN